MDSKLVEELRQKYIKNPPAGYFNSKFLRKEEFPIIVATTPTRGGSRCGL